MEIIGYKAFNKGLFNRYGFQFEVGKVYHALGPIKFGNQGNGFHLCTNLEDCFRYVDSSNVEVALVSGFGDVLSYNDEYNGYYDMYVCEYLRIIRLLSHQEIIDKCLQLTDNRAKHFLMTFQLTNEEVKLFKKYYQNNLEILPYIEYYQENKKDAFVKKRGSYYG